MAASNVCTAVYARGECRQYTGGQCTAPASPTSSMEEEVICRFGRIHNALHGDGKRVIDDIVRTCEEMLYDRGCTSVTTCTNAPRTIATGGVPVACGRGGEGLARCDIDIYVHASEKIGVKVVRQLVTSENKSRVVFISIDGPTPFTRKECEKKDVQFLLARDMCRNPTRHALVPLHSVVSDPPEGIQVSELPRMLASDKIAQYYDWSVGTIVRISRCFGGSEPVDYYRAVCLA